MSAKHPQPEWAPDQLTATWQSASLLLGYPDEWLREQLPVVRDAAACLPERLGSPLLEVVDHLCGASWRICRRPTSRPSTPAADATSS